MTSSDDVFQAFSSESEKLQNMIDDVDAKNDMNVDEIVETYYQVMNVSSMAIMLKQQITESNEFQKIQEIETVISEKFNTVIHPKVMNELSISIQELTQTLQSGNSGEKSREQTELDAKRFEELRQNMSTKEFVQQYENGISND